MLNKICIEYIDMMMNFMENCNPIIIIYGSNIYNVSASDLDVCIIIDSKNIRLVDEIINKTLLFHKQFNLKIDDEIPHKNKLVYFYEEIEEMLSTNPFCKDNVYNIADIEKTKEFLSSYTMKQRLLLNILTTDHKTINDYNGIVKKYENRAWHIILSAIRNYYKLHDLQANEVLELLYKNRDTGAEGEMYLGYKKNNLKKEIYLKSKIIEHIAKEMCKNG